MPEPVEQIRPYGPGKFSTQVDAYVYELAQEGLNDEFTSTDGSWLGLLQAAPETPLYDPKVETKTELNGAEQRFLQTKAGVIIEENGDGLITVDYFETPEELNDAWDALRETKAEVATEEDMDSDLEIPEVSPALQVTDAMLARAEAEGRADGKAGAGRGSTPSMARLDGWSSTYGYQPETHGNELGALTDAWRRGVYLEVAAPPRTAHRTAAEHIRRVSGSTDIDKTLRRTVMTLADGGIPSLVVGGYAVQEHGYARFTQDVDVVVPDVAAARDYLAIRGFRPNAGSNMTLTDRETKAFATAEAGFVRNYCLEHGVLIGVGGNFGNVLRLQPPLVIDEGELDTVFATIAEALEASRTVATA